MLGLVSKSAIRRKIILLFVYNQRKEFYLSEVARQVKTTPGTAQRELKKLLAMDLLVFHKKGNLSLFKLNTRYALLKEIEAIIHKTCGIEVELRKALGKVDGVSFAFIFGSYARGHMKSDSDVDLFIVGRPVEDDIYQAVRAVEEKVGRDINYHIADESEFARKAGSASFIREILGQPLMILGKEDDIRKLIG
ncbi:MAG: nucleotidyltransferase domain-containing protein [Candidatus Aminicenantes bacterium]|nr:nucleotidyltransferase domain-containing protein [Candidatus Aminicenantes bacterium]